MQRRADRAVPRVRAAGLARTACNGFVGLTALTAAVVGLYLVKSAMGINLMPGPSPLHPLYVMLR